MLKSKNVCGIKLQGFTLMEIMFAAMILGFVLVGLLQTYIVCLDLVEISKNTSIAVNNAQAKLEEIKNDTYVQIKSDYNDKPFNVTGITGKGATYARYCNSAADCNDSYAETKLLEVIVSVSWKQRGGRIIGEDKNLNGQRDGTEDVNLNGILDSPVELVTFIAKP